MILKILLPFYSDLKFYYATKIPSVHGVVGKTMWYEFNPIIIIIM